MNLCKVISATALATVLATSGAYACPDHEGKRAGQSQSEYCPMHDQGNPWVTLTEDKRVLLKDAFAHAQEKNNPLREQIKVLIEKRDNQLESVHFDKKTYLATTAKLDSLSARMKANYDQAFASVAPKLTPEQRKMLAKRAQIRHHKSMRQRDGGHREGAFGGPKPSHQGDAGNTNLNSTHEYKAYQK